MRKKEQKKDGAVRPEDVPGGAFYCIVGCWVWSDHWNNLSTRHGWFIHSPPPYMHITTGLTFDELQKIAKHSGGGGGGGLGASVRPCVCRLERPGPADTARS